MQAQRAVQEALEVNKDHIFLPKRQKHCQGSLLSGNVNQSATTTQNGQARKLEQRDQKH